MAELRIGHGFDVHALVKGRALKLGGVTIPHPKGLAGHSDADTLLHAVADAFLGAVGGGDIGVWFPDSDPGWRDADSRQLLQTIVEAESHRPWRLVNLDCTIAAERPRLAPHILEMRQTLAAIFSSTVEQVSVKATTCERLGFIGREEGIAAWAVLLLHRQ